MEQTIREKKLLVLTCPTCGNKNNEPLRVGTRERYRWAKAAAYLDCLTFCDKKAEPKVGDVLNVQVEYPVCCKEGEVFSATIGDDGDFVTMRLLNIKKYKIHSAKLHVRILAIRTRQAYVEPVPEEEKQRLRDSKTYDYTLPDGDWLGEYHYINKNTIEFSNSLGGDIFYYDYIYTDEDGIDHLVQSCYKAFDDQEAYYGDKVLGFHQYSPYFPPSRTLPDGSLAPTIPYGFMERFKRSVANDGGVVPYLQIAIENAKKRSRFSSIDGLYVNVVIYWIARVSIEVYLYAVKTVIEESKDPNETFANNQVKELYNQLVMEMVERSYNAKSLKKYLILNK